MEEHISYEIESKSKWQRSNADLLKKIEENPVPCQKKCCIMMEWIMLY